MGCQGSSDWFVAGSSWVLTVLAWGNFSGNFKCNQIVGPTEYKTEFINLYFIDVFMQLFFYMIFLLYNLFFRNTTHPNSECETFNASGLMHFYANLLLKTCDFCHHCGRMSGWIETFSRSLLSLLTNSPGNSFPVLLQCLQICNVNAFLLTEESQ